MRVNYLLCLTFLLSFWGVKAQVSEYAPHRPATLVKNAESIHSNFQTTSLFEVSGTERTIAQDPVLSKAVRKGTLLKLKQTELSNLNRTQSNTLRLTVPTEAGNQILKLVKVSIVDPNLKVRTSSKGDVSVNWGVHYRGIVEGHTHSIAAISIFDDEVMGSFSSDQLNGNYVLGKIQAERNGEHIVYNDRDLMEARGFGCLTEDDGEGYKASDLLPPPPKEDAGDCVLVYLEIDFNVYTQNGSSLQATTNYVVGLFNQSVTIYANESIAMGINDIFIWTSTTPYSGSAKNIRDDWQANNNSMSGDLGHYLYWQSSGGSGIAAGTDNSLCGSVDGKICVTKTSLNYQTVPTYSRAVKVFTHEMGHLLGSRHTHACVWNGDNTTIDDYGNIAPGDLNNLVTGAEGGSCSSAPSTKVNPATSVPTIMSYYDSFSWGTFSMGNGFGSQPGNVVRNSVASAGCLDPCCDLPEAKCKNISRNLNVNGTKTVGANAVDNNSTYDCGLMSKDISPNTFDCDDVGPNIVTLTITDVYYRVSSCTATITINDNTAPTAKCKNITVFLNANGDAYFSAADINDNSTDACGVKSLAADPSSFHCPTIGAQTSTLTVTDENNNTSSCVAGVFVDDTNAKPDDLLPQNCNSCNQLRIWYCQFDPAPPSLNDFIDGTWQLNDGYDAGNGLYWYNDFGGSQGTPYAGTGVEPPTPNMNLATKTYWYWVAQIDQQSGCIGDAIRVRVRVRKTPILTFNQHPLPFCLNGQLDLAEWVEDANNVTDRYDFYDGDPDLPGANLLGSVTATNGVVDPLMYVVETPVVGNNTYWCVATNKGNANSITCTAKASMTIPVAAPATLNFIPNLTVNNGDPVIIPFSSPNADYIVWVDHVSFNNPDIGLVGGVGWGGMSFTAQNNGPDPVTAMIRVIAYKGNCAGQVQDFYITVNPSPLRQSMMHSLTLAAYKLNVHDVRLEWDIVYDEKLSHFEVEKLKEGVSYSDDVSMLVNADNWEKLGTVDFATAKSSYSFIDREGMSNVTKYRIKLVHKDGTAIWSDVVEIRFDFFDGDRFVVYPNPSDGVFQLKSILPITSEWTYQISDAMGRIVQSGMLTEEDQQFDLQAQTTGIYYMVLRNQEGMRYLKRIVKK